MQHIGTPTVAVIIPNYNYGRFIPKAVESVLSQTIPFHEVIVIDDGSTDNSLSVIEQYRSRAILMSQQNSGQLGACRNAIRACKSEYVYVLDADDWVAPDMIEHLAPKLLEKPAKVQFQLCVTDVDGNQTGSVIPSFPLDYTQERILRDNKVIGFYLCPPTSGNVYRKDILEMLHLERFTARDFLDGTPTLAMPYFGEVVTIRRPLAYYRVHDQNISQSLQIDEAVLQKEISKYYARWKEMEELLHIEYEPLGRTTPFYLSERHLMIAAIRNKWFCVKEVVDFVDGLWKTSYARRQKVVFTVWAIALLIPIARLRKAVVTYRRAGTTRPQWLSIAVGWLNNRR